MIQTLASQGFRSKTKLKRIGVHYFLNFVKKHNAFWTEVVYYMEVLKNKPTKVNVFFVSASFVRNVQIRIEVRFCLRIPEEDSLSERAACKCEAEFVKDTFLNSVLVLTF